MNGKIKKTVLICLCCVCVAAALGLFRWMRPMAEAGGRPVETVLEAGACSSPSLSAKGAILVDGDGQTIYEKNADEKLYPASTTKIMTAITVFRILEETGTTLDNYVIIPKEAAGVEGSSIYLEAGERLTVRELMYGMMLQSGNDAATALALCCGGSMENFIDRMNETAEELGCGNTNFVNPSGLFDEEHYTTARDLARISREAMKNEEFRRIVGSKSWKSDETGRTFVNKNKTVKSYEGATGIKIGYTKSSGRALAASARRNGEELIAVVLNAPDWFDDAYAMLDYGFAKENASGKNVVGENAAGR